MERLAHGQGHSTPWSYSHAAMFSRRRLTTQSTAVVAVDVYAPVIRRTVARSSHRALA